MTESLFFKNLKVHFKNNENVQRLGNIRIAIEVQTTTSPIHRKELLVRITDDTNPFFLYNLSLSEEDFQQLKTQQGLLVDFSSFPQNLIGLLEKCIEEENKDDPMFVLEFFCNDIIVSEQHVGTLKVIQINSFKNLQHLSLKLIHGNDSDLKTYLASCLKVAQEKLDKLEEKTASEIYSLNRDLISAKNQLQEQDVELNKLRNESTGEMGRLVSLHKHELNSEKEKYLTTQEEMQHRHEMEKNEINKCLNKLKGETDAHIKELEATCDSLKSWKYNAEATIREKDTNLDVLNRELDVNSKNLQESRRENLSLKKQFHNNEKAFHEIRMKNGILEQKLSDQEKYLNQVSSSLKSALKQKDDLIGQSVNLNNKLDGLEKIRKAKTQEIEKSNQIIKSLKKELINYMNKIKVKNEVTVRQEGTIQDQAKIIADIKLTIQEKDNLLQKKGEELSQSKNEINESIKKLEEAADIIKTNENLINYLNRQINEVKISSRPRNHETNPQNNFGFVRPSIVNMNGRALPYSTPVDSYLPGAQSSHNIGISTITTSPNMRSNHTQEPSPTRKIDFNNHSSRTDSSSSPIRYNSTKNKENYSPDRPTIDPKYFSKSSDNKELTNKSSKAEQIEPGTINIKNFQKKSIENDPHMNLAQQNAAMSAYFAGRLPKPTI